MSCLPAALALTTILAACGSAVSQNSPTISTSASGSSSASLAAAPAVLAIKPEHNQVRISYNTTTGAMSFVPIAAKQNLGQKYGITVEPQYIGGSGSAAVAALLSGDTQFQVAGGPAPIQAIASGAALKIVANFEEVNGYGIYASPGIKAPADLKGKTVAVAGKGDNTDVSLRAALKKTGVEVDRDVTEVQVGNDAQRIAALQTGKVDAAILDEGAAGSQAEAVGAHNIFSMRQEKIPWATVLVVSDSYAHDNPNTVLATLETVIDGVRFMTNPSNRDATVAVLAQDMKLTPDDKLPQDAYTTYQQREGIFDPTPGTASILDALKTIDPAKYGDASPEKLIDMSYLNKLQAAGFVKVQS